MVKRASDDKLMNFLGLVSFLFAFVDHFAKTAVPLY